MIPLIPFLVDTDIVTSETSAASIVHEWGVVVFEQTGEAHMGSPEFLFPPDEAKAPVVWIHGIPFTGTFMVNTGVRSIVYTWPEPERTALGTAEWDLSGDYTESGESCVIPTDLPFRWAVESYEAVPSLQLHQEAATGWSNFIYYECEVSAELSRVFLENPDPENLRVTAAISQALYFSANGQYLLEFSGGGLVPLHMTVNPELARETFCRWACSRLKSTEIDALCAAWEPVFASVDTGWLVFPIPAEYHNMISSIELLRNDGREVEYERLFLGAVRLNRL